MFEFKKVPQLSQIRHLANSKHIDLQGFCFDMDGTLFNTEGLHLEVSWKAMSEVLPEKTTDKAAFNKLIHGMSDDQVSQSFDLEDNSEKSHEFYRKRKAYWDDAFAKGPKIYHPEIPILLEEIKDSGIPMALVTSSSRLQCQQLLDLTSFAKFFDFVITRDDVVNPKPSTEPYNNALSQLSIKAENCMVFEDSAVGITSASNAGMHIGKVLWYD